MVYSNEEKQEIVTLFIENNQNASAARRGYELRFPNGNIPSRRTIKNIYLKFRRTCNLQRKKRTCGNDENHELNTLLNHIENPKKSLRISAKELSARFGPHKNSRESIRRVLKKYKFRPYKFHTVQKLTEIHRNQRLNFCNLMLNRLNDDRNFFKHILWTDESSFSTSGLPNRQNFRYWASENPHFAREVRWQGRQTVNVWCGILDHKILGPFFFETTLTGQSYYEFLEDRVTEILENLPLRRYQRIVYQHDGAPPHVIQRVKHFLDTNHEEWIGRNGTIAWPSNSPDLTPMDNFLWGYIKNKIYQRDLNNADDIKYFIRHEVNMLNERHAHFIENAINHLQTCYEECVQNEGGNISCDQ